MQNTFSELFLAFGLNFYLIFAPDLLHEFELGVWKAVFIQLLRILYALGGDRIQTLNSRQVSMGPNIQRHFLIFYQVPPNGNVWP